MKEQAEIMMNIMKAMSRVMSTGENEVLIFADAKITIERNSESEQSVDWRTRDVPVSETEELERGDISG